MEEVLNKMANPQTENGYTPIANEILDNAMKLKLNGTQFKIIMAVWRYTYGFSRKESALSDTFLSKSIGIARHNINREIKILFEKRILSVENGRNAGKISVIKFNKNYDEWCIEKDTGIEKESNSAIEKDTGNAIKFDTQENQDIKQKETKGKKPKKDVCESIFEEIYFDGNLELNEIFVEFLKLRKKLKAENTERGIMLLINELKKYDDDIKIAMINKSTVNSWKSVFPLKPYELESLKQRRNQAETEYYRKTVY